MRAKRQDDALEFARREKGRYGKSYSLLMVHAIAGRVSEAVKAFRSCVQDSGMSPEALYGDEDLGPVLRSDAFKALHAEFPPEAAPETQPAATQPER